MQLNHTAGFRIYRRVAPLDLLLALAESYLFFATKTSASDKRKIDLSHNTDNTHDRCLQLKQVGSHQQQSWAGLFIHYPTPATPHRATRMRERQREKIGKSTSAPIGFCARRRTLQIIAFAFNIDWQLSAGLKAAGPIRWLINQLHTPVFVINTRRGELAEHEPLWERERIDLLVYLITYSLWMRWWRRRDNETPCGLSITITA